jgi:hypothetical protein
MTSHLDFRSSTWAGKSQRSNKGARGKGGGGGLSHLEHADTGLETRNNGLSEKLDLGIRFAALFERAGAVDVDLIQRVQGDRIGPNPVQDHKKSSDAGLDKDGPGLWKRRCMRSNAGSAGII